MNERPIDDETFRLEVVKRTPILTSLQDQPRTMGELDEAVPTSRSTIHRALGTFEDLGLVRKADQSYALTGFGRTVAERTRAFAVDLETVRGIDEFLNAVDPDVDVPTEHFRDAEVVRPEPHKADQGVKRIIDLIEATDDLRMFSNVLSPVYADVAHREMLAGMEIEVVFDERIRDPLVTEYAEAALEAFRTGRFDVFFGNDVPFELFLHDDGMAMAAHSGSAVPRMFVEADADAAVAWAEDLYGSHHEAAERFDPGMLGPSVAGELSSPVDD